MAEYQNKIMLGVALESKDSIEGKLKTLIGALNTTKIDLDINIKNSDVAKQLETLTNLANNFKNSLGGNINLGNVNEIINQATSSMERLNGEVLKTRTILDKENGTGSRYSDIANGIGIVTKQTEVLNQETKKWELTEEGKTKTIVNNEKIRKTLDDLTQAQEKLNALESRGNVDSNETDRLKGLLSNASENISGKNDIYKSSDISGYLNEVKQLENEEKNNIQLANEIQDAWDKAYKERVNSEQNTISQIETNEKKAYDNEILRLGEKAVAEQKAEQDLINQMANGREKSELKTQKTDRSEEIAQSKAINQSLEENYKLEQEKDQILIKQSEAYRQIESLKNNGIINSSDISNLEKMVQESNSLKDINNALKSIMSTSMMKESSLITLSKQIDDAQIKLDKMKQTFGNKLPNGFTDSIQSSLNKLKEDLKTANEFSFNGIKNNLNQVNNEMKVTTNETQQLVNSLKETNNGGFFSNMSNFLGKIGVFYGVQQVVQEISQQFKNAGDYTQALDKNVTNIQMITSKSKEEVIGLTNQFKQLGEQLHITNQEMLAGSEELLRAGYDNDTTGKMLEASSMASKISGQTTQATTEQLIAIKNSFNMTGDQMQHVIDVISKLDNTSATSFKEISSAIMRTAFSAQQAGTSFDTLSSYVTTVSEKTRRSAETIGEAFKTIYSRLTI